jgi:hypothetical protein
MRIPYIATGCLSIALALVMSLPAAAQNSTSPQQESPAAAPSQSTPSQSSPSQTAPGQAGAPAAPAQNRAQTQSQAGDDNPLNLTEDQKAKIRPILMEQNQQLEALHSDTTMTQEQKMAKANEIRQATSPKIKAILTPEQLQKLAELQKARQQQSAPADEAPPKK